MADMQAGSGSCLGVFLLARDWDRSRIGIAMSLGGFALASIALWLGRASLRRAGFEGAA